MSLCLKFGGDCFASIGVEFCAIFVDEFWVLPPFE